ncbi:hypothetical protein [Pantoea dispersa]|uniref:hypothetical protein n=1 Tax=Pantoea dispersa TaxID=59814 RepID=UPI001CA6BCD9|nr:hypothetical protein [Pantoea dispersa]QZY97616.1 hypothetical protein K7X52_24070 [Pantoea dispersa]
MALFCAEFVRKQVVQLFIRTSGRLASPTRTLQKLIERAKLAGDARVQGTMLASAFVKAVIQ